MINLLKKQKKKPKFPFSLLYLYKVFVKRKENYFFYYETQLSNGNENILKKKDN